MESGEILVEVNSEEIQTCHTRLQCIEILLYAIMIVLGCLESKASRLFVAPSVPWYEEDRNTLDLLRSQTCDRAHGNCMVSYLRVLVETSFPMQIKVVFARESRMLGIKVGEFEIDGTRPAHVASFGVELASEKGVDNSEKQHQS